MHCFGAGAHHDDDLLGVGGADVVEQVVLPAGQRGEFVHGVLHDARGLEVVLVDRLATLEVDVRVLGRTADGGPVGRQAAQAVGLDEVVVNHGADGFAGYLVDLLDLVRVAEPVEEVHEGHARSQSRGVRHQGQVADLLDAGGGQQAEAGLAHGHDVGVVAEDRQGLAGQ